MEQLAIFRCVTHRINCPIDWFRGVIDLKDFSEGLIKRQACGANMGSAHRISELVVAILSAENVVV